MSSWWFIRFAALSLCRFAAFPSNVAYRMAGLFVFVAIGLEVKYK